MSEDSPAGSESKSERGDAQGGSSARKWMWIGALAVAAAVGVVLWFVLAQPSWLETPDGFVEVDDVSFEYKAVSPDGSVIAVRHRDNDEDGDLEFWTEVFQREMVDGKGYRLVDTRDLTSSDGVDGKHLQLEYALAGDTPYHYGLSVFVTEDSIVTLETATELDALPRHEEAFESARASVEVRTAEGFLAR